MTVKALKEVDPGTWIVIKHPGADMQEMQTMGHKGYWEVASHGDDLTKSLTSPKVKEAIQRRGIQSASYHDM